MRGAGKLGLTAGASLVALCAGCAGGYVSTGAYVDPGVPVYTEPYYSPYVPVPDVYVFGGYAHPHHYYAPEFSHRGYESRYHSHDVGHVGRAPGVVHGSSHGGDRGRQH